MLKRQQSLFSKLMKKANTACEALFSGRSVIEAMTAVAVTLLKDHNISAIGNVGLGSMSCSRRLERFSRCVTFIGQ